MKIFRFQRLLAIAAMWSCAHLAAAQDAPRPTPRCRSTPPVSHAPRPCRKKNWRFGVALGYGERTNPLIQSDDIPVVVDLDIAWFGERWFFDNFDLGFELFDRPSFTTNIVARVNSDRAFFSKTNTKYINFSYLGGGGIGASSRSGTGRSWTNR